MRLAGAAQLCRFLNAHARFQSADAIAGNGNLRSLGVFEGDDDLAGEPGVDLVDPFDVDECGAVDAEEAGRVEAALEFGDGLIDPVPAAGDDGVGELVLGDEVGDGVEVEEGDALADTGGDSAGIVGALGAKGLGERLKQAGEIGALLPIGFGDGAEAAQLVQCACELCGLDGLDEVVDGVDLEGAERVLVVSGGEDDEGLMGEAGEEIEAGEAGHLNVEEEDVNGFAGFVEELEGLGGIGGAAGDGDAVKGGEHAREALDGEGFVVYQISAERGGFHWRFHDAGKEMRTAVRPLSRLTSSRPARP